MVQLQVIIFVFSVLSFSLTIMFHILPSYSIGTKGIWPKPHYRTSKAENICGLRYSLIQEKRKKKKAGGEQTNKNQQEKQVMKKKKKSQTVPHHQLIESSNGNIPALPTLFPAQNQNAAIVKKIHSIPAKARTKRHIS